MPALNANVCVSSKFASYLAFYHHLFFAFCLMTSTAIGAVSQGCFGYAPLLARSQPQQFSYYCEGSLVLPVAIDKDFLRSYRRGLKTYRTTIAGNMRTVHQPALVS